MGGDSRRARELAAVPRHARRRRLTKMRFHQRKRWVQQLRQARRLTTLLRARKATVIAVVGGVLVSLLALGGTLGALAAHHWWAR